MDIKVYTMKGCGFCDKMKELVRRANLEYTEVMIDRDVTAQEYFDTNGPHPARKQFPQMVIDDELIGGLTPAVKYFVQHKLITKSS